LYDLLKIVFVASLAVIDAAKDWVTEVDAHLPTVSAAPPREARMLTHISVPKSPFFRHIAACWSSESWPLRYQGDVMSVNYGGAIVCQYKLPFKPSEVQK
jgi:hypothetical protein